MTQSAAPITMPADWRDFFALTKPRVMTLVVFTGLCGLLAAPGSINPVLGFTAILCIALGAGGAATLNQWWEADIDAGMKRTSNRPLPTGRMRREDARDFSDMVQRACEVALAEGIASDGDRLVITAGVPFGTPGMTNVLRVAWVGDTTELI